MCKTYENQDKQRRSGGGWVTTAISSFIIVVIVELIWPDVIPFTLFEFWKLDITFIELIKVSWPVFAWGTGVSLIRLLLTRNDPWLNRNAEVILVGGGLISTWAGIFEEIGFRWIIFYGQIIGYKLMNWLMFGWAGFGLFEWLYLHVTAPIANFFTLGLLEPILINGIGWAIGAAVISSNGKFRSGHVYQGPLGWINSWFIGMFLFYLMFQYGLFASIIVHFLYDLFIFIVAYIDAAVERALGWT